ncbi:Transcription factor SFL2 [Candida tropicalis]
MSKKSNSTNNPGDPRVKKNAFVHKLYTMLNDPNLSHLIWWTTNNVEGNTFALYPGKEFANCLTRYFKHGNVASFVRQLHMYGFHKVSDPHNSSSSSSALSINHINSPYSMNIVHQHQNNAGGAHNNKDVPPIWEFKHSSGKFKKGDEKSLALIKRRSSSNSSSGSRNNSYNETLTLQNHVHPVPQQPMYQEYPIPQQNITYDPYNLNMNFQQQQPPPPPPQPFMYYNNQPQPVPPPLPPPLAANQQQLPTPQFVYGQPYFQYPGSIIPPQSQPQPVPQPPPQAAAPPVPSGVTQFTNFSQFPSPSPQQPISQMMNLQPSQNSASNTPQIQQPTPQHVEPPTKRQDCTPDHVKLESLSKSPHQNSAGYNATLQFRKIWDDNNGPVARQRNPSLLYDPLTTIPPTTTPQQQSKSNEGSSSESILPPPSQLNRSSSLNSVPLPLTSSQPSIMAATPPEMFRRSTTPLLHSLSHSSYNNGNTTSRLSNSIPRNSSPLALSSTTAESTPTPNIVSSSSSQPSTSSGLNIPNVTKKPSLFSSSLQERLRPSVFDIHHNHNHQSGIKSPSTIQDTYSKKNSIVSNTSSIFSNKSSISSIASTNQHGINNNRPSLSSITNSHVKEEVEEEVKREEIVIKNGKSILNNDNSKSWTPMNGNASGAQDREQRSLTESPNLKSEICIPENKKVSVNSLLKDDDNEDKTKMGAKNHHLDFNDNNEVHKSRIVTIEKEEN